MNGIFSPLLVGMLGGLSGDPLGVLRFLESRRQWEKEFQQRQQELEERRRAQELERELEELRARVSTASLLRTLGARPDVISRIMTEGLSKDVFSPTVVEIGKELPLERQIEQLVRDLPYIQSLSIETTPAKAEGKPYVPERTPLPYEPPPSQYEPPRTIVKAEISPFTVPEPAQMATLLKLKDVLPQDTWESIATGKYTKPIEELLEEAAQRKEIAKKWAPRFGVREEALYKFIGGIPTDELEEKFKNIDETFQRTYEFIKKKKIVPDDNLAKLLSLSIAFGAPLGALSNLVGEERKEEKWTTFTRSVGPYNIRVQEIFEDGKLKGHVPLTVELNQTYFNQVANHLNLLTGRTGGIDSVGKFLRSHIQQIMNPDIDVPEKYKKEAIARLMTTVSLRDRGAPWAILSTYIDDTSPVGSSLKEKVTNLYYSQRPSPFNPSDIPNVGNLLQVLTTNDPLKKIQEIKGNVNKYKLSEKDKNMLKESISMVEKIGEGTKKRLLRSLDQGNIGEFTKAVNELIVLLEQTSNLEKMLKEAKR